MTAAGPSFHLLRWVRFFAGANWPIRRQSQNLSSGIPAGSAGADAGGAAVDGGRGGPLRHERPYTDSDYQADVRRGLPALRDGWIVERGDTEDYVGRSDRPEDNGRTRAGGRNLDEVFAGSTRRTRRAVAGRVVTQLAYTRRGEINSGDGVRRLARRRRPRTGPPRGGGGAGGDPIELQPPRG